MPLHLPDVFAGDADRLARFEREAKTLASRCCLEKDSKRRLSSIGDVRLELEEAASAVAPPEAGRPHVDALRRRRHRVAWTVAAVMALLWIGPASSSSASHRISLALFAGSRRVAN